MMEINMKCFASIACTMLIMAVASLDAAATTNPGTTDRPADDALFATVSRLDAELFHTFNHCASPDQ